MGEALHGAVSGPMHVISFDVGIRNLAECRFTISHERLSITHWAVTDVAAASKAKLANIPSERVAKMLLLYLHANADDYDAAARGAEQLCVLIENQPPKTSTKVKAVQYVLYGFFAARYPSCTVKFVSPRLKLAHDPSAGTVAFAPGGSYRDNKANVVAKAAYVVSCLSDEDLSAAVRGDWDAKRKQDDLADALLQGLAATSTTVPSA